MERLWECIPYFPKSFPFLFHCVLYLFSHVPIVLLLENNNNKQSWFFSRYSGFHVNWCELVVSLFNTKYRNISYFDQVPITIGFYTNLGC